MDMQDPSVAVLAPILSAVWGLQETDSLGQGLVEKRRGAGNAGCSGSRLIVVLGAYPSRNTWREVSNLVVLQVQEDQICQILKDTLWDLLQEVVVQVEMVQILDPLKSPRLNPVDTTAAEVNAADLSQLWEEAC